ncbi:hypothetical protein [Escherichia coli]|uniref:hypothetical protein n=1 Tax=Escherichia coli TaxID=562 RepID=UPI00244E5696|nr:hypothetical protein [Escherichia coli]
MKEPTESVRRPLPVCPGTTTCSTTALDVDLTPASGFTSDSKRQFASIGAEFNAWKWTQLRAGYRQNMANNSGSAFTARCRNFTV